MHTAQTQTGFFPGYIRYLCPVLFDAFTDIAFTSITMQRISPLTYTQVMDLFGTIHLPAAALVLAAVAFRMRIWLRQTVTCNEHHRNLGLISSLMLTGLVIAVSFRYDAHAEGTASYLQEVRYFAPLTVFLQQWLIAALKAPGLSSAFRRLLYPAALLLLLTTLHGIYFTTKMLAEGHRPFKADRATIEERVRTLQVLDSFSNQAASRPIYFASYDSELSNIVALRGFPVMRKLALLQQPDSLKSKAAATIVVAVPKKNMRLLSALINGPGTRPLGCIHSLCLYYLPVQPIQGNEKPSAPLSQKRTL